MNPMSTSDGVVDQVLGSAYQVVKYVASNMELLISLGESLDTLEPIYEDIKTVVSIKNQVVNVSDNMSIVAALAAIIPALTNIHNNMPALLKVSTNTDALVALSQNITQLLAVPGQVAEMLSSQDFKNSVVAATTGNITLSGLMSLDGKAIPVNGRVLVKDQTNPVENGIYLAKVTAWVRAADAVGTYLSTGNMVLVDGGDTQAGHIYRLATEGTITPGTTAQVWKDITPNASTLERGLARAATKEEVAAGSSTNLFVSPKELAEYAGLGEKNTLATVGNGTSLVKGKDGTTLQIKALAVGNGLSIVDEGDQVKLVSDVGEAPDLKLYARTSAGWVEIPESSGSLDLSGLDTAGQPITLSNVEVIALNTTQFSVDTGGIVALRQEFIDSLNGSGGGTSGVDSASNMGTGVGIFGSKLGTDLQFRSLKAGAGINIATQGAGEIVISSTVAAGEANTASSLGTGNSIVGTKNGVDLRFKSIKAGTNITISADTNELVISATDTGEVNTLQSKGTGTSLVGSKTGSALGVKSLKAGSNITITDTGDEVTINATSSGGGSGGVDVSGADVGNTPVVVADVSTLVFDPEDFELSGNASGMQASLRNGVVVRSVADVAVTGGKSLIFNDLGGNVRLRKLFAGSNVTIAEDATGKLTISSTGGSGGSGSALGVTGSDAQGNDVDYTDCRYLSIDGNAFELVLYDNDEPPIVGKEAYFQIRPSWITDVVANKLNVTNLDGAGASTSTLLSSAGLKFSNAFTIENDPADQGVIVKLANQSGGLTEVPHDNAEDSRKFVRGWNAWFTATTWDASLFHVGGAGLSKSLVSMDQAEENKLKIKGLLPGRGIELAGTAEENNVTIQFKEILAENLGYPTDYGTTFKVPCGGFGVVSAATELMSAFTANMFYAMPFYVHQPNALVDGFIYQIDATGKPTTGNLEISIGKYNEGNEQIDIIYFMSRPYVDEGAGLYTRPVAPDFEIAEPGLYWLIMRTTVNASGMKMLTLKNDLRYRDNSNVSRVMQQFDRYAVAAMESKSSSLDLGRPTVNFSSWDGVTVCPYVEVSFRYPV